MVMTTMDKIFKKKDIDYSDYEYLKKNRFYKFYMAGT